VTEAEGGGEYIDQTRARKIKRAIKNKRKRGGTTKLTQTYIINNKYFVTRHNIFANCGLWLNSTIN
jgi:hypothetical protein